MIHGVADPRLSLESIETRAARRGLRLRLRAPRNLGIWSLPVSYTHLTLPTN